MDSCRRAHQFGNVLKPIEVLYQRHNHPDWRPKPPFNPDDRTSSDQKAINFLIYLRMAVPGRSWPEYCARGESCVQLKVPALSGTGGEYLCNVQVIARVRSNWFVDIKAHPNINMRATVLDLRLGIVCRSTEPKIPLSHQATVWIP